MLSRLLGFLLIPFTIGKEKLDEKTYHDLLGDQSLLAYSARLLFQRPLLLS